MGKKVLLIVVAVTLLFCSTVYASDEINVPILLYHNLISNFDNQNNLLHITPNRFDEHMQALNNAGYNTISYKEYIGYVNGENTLPNNPILIDFDDGYESNYEYAYPILKKYGMKATIFVVTASVDNKNTVYPHFSWNSGKEMLQSGLIELGSHTNSHRNLKTLTKEQTIYEIRKSKYLLEKNLGIDCTLFAYPYGFDNEYSLDILKECGFKVVNMVGDKGTNYKKDGLFSLKRLTVSGNLTGDELLEMIDYNKKLD